MSRKKFSIILLICILCTYTSWYLIENIEFKKELEIRNKDKGNLVLMRMDTEILNNDFWYRYQSGLYLIPSVLICALILVVLTDDKKRRRAKKP